MNSTLNALSDDELIVFVDEDGRPTGETGPKLASHHATTRLHLAFSCYVFDGSGRLLVTRRAEHKRVWPGVWTNTVCGHPAPGEDMKDAIRRRLQYELGMEAREFECALPDYTYKTPPFNDIIEHEFCPVFVAKAASEASPNPMEVCEMRWMDWSDFVAAAQADETDEYSWWCKDQVRLLSNSKILQEYTLGAK